MEIAKRGELRKLEIESQLGLEVKQVDSAIALAAKHIEEAKAQAEAERARTEIVLAQEHVQTERERAVATRSREMALKRVEEQGAVDAAKADTDAGVLLRKIGAESEAMRTQAEANRTRMVAQSEGERALIAAENSRSEALVRLKLEQYRLDKLPEIVSQMMKPAEKIESIRIHQITGFGGGPGSATAADGAGKPPVNQVMDSILGMALQLPALKSIGDQIGLDFSSAIGSTTEHQPSPEDGGPKRKAK